MSDEKQAKELNDDELDKVSGGANVNAGLDKDLNRGGHLEDHGEGHKVFETGGHRSKLR